MHDQLLRPVGIKRMSSPMSSSNPTGPHPVASSTDGDAPTEVKPEKVITGEPSAVPKAVHDVLNWAETVAAPVGVVVALLVFFGRTYSRAYFGRFGIDQHLLQYSAQDQGLLSADAMFGTAVLVLAVAMLLVLADRLLTPLRSREDRVGRVARVSPPVIRPDPAGRWSCIRIATAKAADSYSAPGSLSRILRWRHNLVA